MEATLAPPSHVPAQRVVDFDRYNSPEVEPDLFADQERFSSRLIVLPKAAGELHNMIPTTPDPPDHRPYRFRLWNTHMPGSASELSI